MKLTDEEVRASRAADRGTLGSEEGGTPHAELLRAATERLAWVKALPHSGRQGVGQAQREALLRSAENSLAELEGKPPPHRLRKRSADDDTVWPVGDPRGPLERKR